MKKKLLSLALALVMVCAVAVPASASELTTNGYGDEYLNHLKYCMENGLESIVPDWYKEEYYGQKPTFKHYPDVPNDAWYAEAVNAMTEGGLLRGHDDGLFHPDEVITIGELATVICRVGGEGLYEDKPRVYVDVYYGRPDSPYRDWESHWAYHAINQVEQGHIANWYPDDADSIVTRYMAFYVMSNLARRIPAYMEDFDPHFVYIRGELANPKEFKQLTDKVWTIDDIPDADTTVQDLHGSTYPLRDTGIEAVYNLGITQGVDELGTCAPNEPLTRAQLCQTLYNMGIICKRCIGMNGNTGFFEIERSAINPGPRQTTAD